LVVAFFNKSKFYPSIFQQGKNWSNFPENSFLFIFLKSYNKDKKKKGACYEEK